MTIPVHQFVTKNKGRGLCVFHEGVLYSVLLGRKVGRRFQTGTYVIKKIDEIACLSVVPYVYADILRWEEYTDEQSA